MFLLNLILKQEIVPSKGKIDIFSKFLYLFLGLFMIVGFYALLFDGESEFFSKIPFIIRLLFFAYIIISYLSMNAVKDYLNHQDRFLKGWLFYPYKLGVTVLFGPFVLLYNKEEIEKIQKEYLEREEVENYYKKRR